MLETKTYEPDNSIKKGILSIFGEIFHEFSANKWLTYQLFKRDFIATYKQSAIGLFWAIIIPVFSVSAFIILSRSGIFNAGDVTVPYPIFAVLGVAFWQLFSVGLIGCTNSLAEAGGMIKIISFSKKSLVLAASGRALVSFLVQMGLVVVLFFWFGQKPHWQVLLLPFFILPILLLTFGLGLIFSLINAVMRDVGNALSVLMTFMMFLTPVLYVSPQSGFLSKVTAWNPMYYFISVPRELILSGRWINIHGYFWSAFFAVVVFGFCLVLFHLTETKITERV